jgi:peptide/nickel transport system permease protein
VGHAFQGNLGTSVINPGKTVLSVIAGALPWTLLITGFALLISFAVGVLVGTVIAAFPDNIFAKIATGIVSFLAAVPNYIVALVLIYVVADQHHLLPASGSYSLTVTPGFNAGFIGSVVQHAILPVLSYVIVAFGGWALTMKGSVSTILGADYVRAGEAWGLSRWRVTRSYIGRNAMLPMVTNLALSFGYIFGGSVFIETYFVYPGLGYYLIQSVQQRDYPVMMGCFILITVAVVIANLVVDFAYPLVDPRIMSPAGARRRGITVSGLAAETQAERQAA